MQQASKNPGTMRLLQTKVELMKNPWFRIPNPLPFHKRNDAGLLGLSGISKWHGLILALMLTRGVEGVGQDGSVLWQSWIFPASSPPAIASDGTVYIGSSRNLGNGLPAGKLSAFSSEGVLQWEFDTEGGLNAAPAIAGDGTLYFGTSVRLGDTWPPSTFSKFYALNPDGSKQWEYESRSAFGSAALDARGIIYVADVENLLAFDSTGLLLWAYPLASGISAALKDTLDGVVIAVDGTIYAPSVDGRLHAVNTDGTKRWEFSVGITDWSNQFPKGWSGLALAADGTLYLGTRGGIHGPSFGGTLYALNPDGSLQWEFAASSAVFTQPVVGVDGSIYVGSSDGILHALDPDGRVQWSVETRGALRSSPVLDAVGNLYFAAPHTMVHDRVYALGPQGEGLWEFDLSAHGTSSFALSGDGVLYVAAGENLYAMQAVAGLGATPWPTVQQNSQRTGRGPWLLPSPPAGEAPRFISQPASQTVASGGLLEFTVEVSGSGPISLQWWRSGEPLPGETNETLHLGNVALSDAGVYAVIASNPVGRVSSRPFELVVHPVLPSKALPIAMTGWNLDVVEEDSASPFAYGFEMTAPLAFEDTEGARWFETGLEGQEHGLPKSRQFTSAANPDVLFELQPYTNNNVLKLGSAPTLQTSELALVTPAPFSTLHLLAASGLNGGGFGHVVLDFADGTQSLPLPFNAQEWFSPSPKMALTGLTALSDAWGTREFIRRKQGAALHQTDLDLTSLGLNEKPLVRMSFTKPGGAGWPYVTAIFAVSGVPAANVSRPELSNPRWLDGHGFEFTAAAPAGQIITVEASNDLLTWSPLTNVVTGVEAVTVVDPSAGSQTSRFYRALLD
jgi:hypothetical protein